MFIRQEVRDKKIQCCMGDILQELMTQEDIGLTELSNMLGVPYGRVKSWLTRKRPKIDWEVYRCAEFFRVPVTYLVYGVWCESYTKKERALNGTPVLIENKRLG
jgi:hypothetical protein